MPSRATVRVTGPVKAALGIVANGVPWLIEELVQRVLHGKRGRVHAEGAYAHGYNALKRRDWIHAASLGKIAVEADPSWPDGHILLGYAHFRAGHLAQAKAAFEEGVRQIPEDVRLLTYLGAVMSALGEFRTAAEIYRRAASLSPRDRAITVQLAAAMADDGQLETAKAILESARVLAPDDSRLLACLAQVQAKLGQSENAIVTARQAVERSPDCAPAHYALGLGLMGLRHWHEALAAFGRAAELDPSNGAFREAADDVTRRLSRQAPEGDMGQRS